MTTPSTHKQPHQSKPSDSNGPSAGWRSAKLMLASLAATVLLHRAEARGAALSELTASPEADPRAVEIGERMAEILARAKAAKAAKPAAPKTSVGSTTATAAKVAGVADQDVQIHLRPGNQTVMQIRGQVLQSAVQGVGKTALVHPREQTARTFLRANRALLRLADPDNELELKREETDDLGQHHLRFQQKHLGVPVWPAGLSVHLDAQGNVDLLDGAYAPTPALNSVQPGLTGAEAVAQAKSSVPNGLKLFTSEPELIVYALLHQPARLAWKFELTASVTSAWLFVVDAKDGRILHRGDRVCDTQAQGSGLDLGGKTRVLSVWGQGGGYYLVDTTKKSYNAAFDPLQDPHGVITISDANGTPSDQVLQATVAIVSSASATQWEIPSAVSAAFNFSQTYDYYLDRHGRNSLDAKGGNISAIVRVGNYDNASWNGNVRVMLFGDVQPYAGSLDVVGHELTHGVTEDTAGLVYENQSGALNEAMSDIFGEMVEARSFGQNDWLIGSSLAAPFRNMRDPGAIFSHTIGRPFPSKMSEFAQLEDTTDHGGVHINSSIINHAFYLVAEGLDGGLGLRDAERIFYRALTQHLQPQSQFIDGRLACVASAEELFGKDSIAARKTSQAFDAVEVFAAPTTPDPTPVPVVSGPDSTLFVAYDPFWDEFDLARRETSQGDDQSGSILAFGVNLARPAVTGDGAVALFVNPDNDLCAVETADPDSRECLGYPGRVHSVAISPDGSLGAFVLRDEQTGEPDGKITVINFAQNTAKTYNLVAPSSDGMAVDGILYADSMTFSTDGQALIYDALSQIKFGHGSAVQRWSIYSLELATEQTSMLVAPQAGKDTGNPTLGRAGNRYLAYDSRDEATGDSAVMVLDLFTGRSAQVGSVQGGFGYPSFLGDESGLIYAARDANAPSTGFSLVKQDLAPDRLSKQGEPALWYLDAPLGIIYRRGDFQATNDLPTVTLSLSSASAPAQGNVTLTAAASDADGSVAKVEFYNGSEKLGEATAAPYTYAWSNLAPGTYRLVARAIDNVGGSADSAPATLSVGAPAGDGVKIRATALEKGTIRLVITGAAGSYIIQQSTDLKTWVDIYPVTIDNQGTGRVDDSGGPMNNSRLFYRVRRD